MIYTLLNHLLQRVDFAKWTESNVNVVADEESVETLISSELNVFLENGKDIDVGNPFFVVLISKLMDKLSVDFSAKYKSIEVTKIPDGLETSNICAIGLEHPVLNIVLLYRHR